MEGDNVEHGRHDRHQGSYRQEEHTFRVQARTTTLVRDERLNDYEDLVKRINLINAHKLLRYMLILPTFYASSSRIVDPLIDMETRQAFGPVQRSLGEGTQIGVDEAAICLKRRSPRGGAPTKSSRGFPPQPSLPPPASSASPSGCSALPREASIILNTHASGKYQ
jgi:hypothetical protein